MTKHAISAGATLSRGDFELRPSRNAAEREDETNVYSSRELEGGTYVNNRPIGARATVDGFYYPSDSPAGVLTIHCPRLSLSYSAEFDGQRVILQLTRRDGTQQELTGTVFLYDVSRHELLLKVTRASALSVGVYWDSWVQARLSLNPTFTAMEAPWISIAPDSEPQAVRTISPTTSSWIGLPHKPTALSSSPNIEDFLSDDSARRPANPLLKALSRQR